MIDSTLTSKHVRRWLARAGWAMAAAAIVAGYIDYSMFNARKQEALTPVFVLGGSAYSIGGWPFGEENVISFARALSDSELQSLAILNRLNLYRRHHVTVIFKNCDLSESRLVEIRGILDNCEVNTTVK